MTSPRSRVPRSLRWPLRVGAGLAVSLVGVCAYGVATGIQLVSMLEKPAFQDHVHQSPLTAAVQAGNGQVAFEVAFAEGDELFEAKFNVLDGAGANVGNGEKFTRVPRADLTASGGWASHIPSRETGPNAQSCTTCHAQPTEDGAGTIASNVHRDPQHTGDLGKLIQRNTTHTFGLGALQRLAEEMTEDLFAVRLQAWQESCAQGGILIPKPLVSKGVDFGIISVRCSGFYSVSQIKGVSFDLVVRPFQWKGSVANIREFNRKAAHNELGMQGVELVGVNYDGDADGIVNELSVGDITAMTIYVAAQPRPTTKVELASLGLIPALSSDEADAIALGSTAFDQIGCNGCHVRQMKITNPVFSEPSQNASYRDSVFPTGVAPASLGLDHTAPIRFDLTQDQPDNVITNFLGQVTYRLGSLQKDTDGAAIVELLGDMKRHDMGEGLAEAIDETGTGASVFMTENLWGVGSTAPYLHDGRATTLTEAILAHGGGEGAASQAAFVALPIESQKAILAFLNNQVLFKLP